MVEGWKCPRCKRINAPFVNQCTCSEDEKKSVASYVECDHFWIYLGSSLDNTVNYYRCSKCNMEKYEPTNRLRTK